MMQNKETIASAFYITFSGNCKKALILYQSCFGGDLHFDIFDEKISGIEELPVISGFLVSDKITIYGSDLVHNEGRRVGNVIAVYVHCKDNKERFNYLKKLSNNNFYKNHSEQKLIEITDAFEVRWIFGI
jgi:uncharacterized glyoxalase superfamily protein PhnB